MTETTCHFSVDSDANSLVNVVWGETSVVRAVNYHVISWVECAVVDFRSAASMRFVEAVWAGNPLVSCH